MANEYKLLQWSVASDGRGVEVEVVLSELAPFSSSDSTLVRQMGRNLANVLAGSALATHSTSWWMARTAFDRTLVLAYWYTLPRTRSYSGSDRWTHIWLQAPVTASTTWTSRGIIRRRLQYAGHWTHLPMHHRLSRFLPHPAGFRVAG